MFKKIALVCFSLVCIIGICTATRLSNRNHKEDTTMETATPILVIETTQGTFEVTLMPDVAPRACLNIVGLAKKEYYNGTTFHRVIPGFMIQGGDPSGTGRGGASLWNAPFADECSPEVTFNKPGLLAMANRGKHTNGSQFFITTVPTPHLNGNHTIFGWVSKGMDVVHKIEQLGSETGQPLTLVKIISITVREV
jgi:peptidylprolyl isomerase